jgi:inner membrane protein
MPLPLAHALVGASVAAALRPSGQSQWKPLLVGAFLGICPDFDYALNWLRISGGGWHHGFTHSIAFAFLVALITVVISREWKVRSFVLFSAATVSHTLLDFLITESYGVALWWPFTDQRYKLRLPNPIDYTWSSASHWSISVGVLRITLIEFMIFAPIFLIVLMVRKRVGERSVASIYDARTTKLKSGETAVNHSITSFSVRPRNWFVSIRESHVGSLGEAKPVV